MRHTLVTTLAAAALLGATLTASAVPMLHGPEAASAPDVTLVAQGCGPGFHRGFRGFCRPNGYYRPGFYRRGPAYRGGWHRYF